MRWNDPSVSRPVAPFISDIVKVRIADLNLGNIDQICLVDENIYFMGYKGKEVNLYTIHTYFFFNNKTTEQSILTLLPQKDQPIPKARTIVNHSRNAQNPDFLYVKSDPASLTLKAQQVTYEISSFSSNINVYTPPVIMFPVLVW